MPNCTLLQKGDRVIRYLGGIEISGRVMLVENDTLKVAMLGTEHWPIEELWTFDRRTGAEEDPELGWGVSFGVTGSYIKAVSS